jgi:hypothetical protein
MGWGDWPNCDFLWEHRARHDGVFEQIPRDPIYTATSHLNLAPRLDLLMAVLAGSPDPDASELAQLFADARALADERNRIVHNPLMSEVYEDGNGGYDFQHAIQSMKRTEKRLTLADLTRIRENGERLAAELYRVAACILQRRRIGEAETRSADA